MWQKKPALIIPNTHNSFFATFTDHHGYMFKRLLLQDVFRVPEDVQIIGFDGINIFGSEEGGLFKQF